MKFNFKGDQLKVGCQSNYSFDDGFFYWVRFMPSGRCYSGVSFIEKDVKKRLVMLLDEAGNICG